MNEQSYRACRVVSEANFETEVLHSEQPTLVAFGALWSKPCLILEPVLAEVEAEIMSRGQVFQVNVDDNPDLGMWYGIESIPTLICFVAGKACFRIVGTVSKQVLIAKLQPYLSAR